MRVRSLQLLHCAYKRIELLGLTHCVEEAVFFLVEVFVSSSVERELASLTEGLSATVNSTDKWLLVSVGILVLSEILRK